MTDRQIIAGVTGSRADFGIQRPVFEAIRAEPGFALDLYVTGMHLSADFGNTAREVEEAGFVPAGRIDCAAPGAMPGDGAATGPVMGGSDLDIARSTASGLAGFAAAWTARRPDLVLLLGDRFETFAAASAAYLLNIPIAHICGGDVTAGSLDDGLRHAISKFASLHFTTNAPARARLTRMGEAPETVFNTGTPALDSILSLRLLSRAEVERRVGAPLGARYLVVTFHPATAERESSASEQFAELLAALATLEGGVSALVTYANADAGGMRLNEALEEAARQHGHIVARESLGQLLYLSALKHAALVVGNSSSGLYEAPSFGIPTVNIGSRQDGRLKARSVIDCAPGRDSVSRAIARGLKMKCQDVRNPYGDGQATAAILDILRRKAPFSGFGPKHFYEGGQPGAGPGAGPGTGR